ncbi:uncharacterized protein Dwil_GK10821 [Drosophila willistoni]|uniref:G patch domain-containing protein 11 n=1 Tax=Drosophila willistoni TaxID=7260 RepID=B4NAB5_DROWI|nr:G patch domain-containing protein 11 [Drosophila willistoni]EDW81802.1 uncharacterized protein Dwil_GK10821 [Drosophila willistoni]
MSDSDEDYMSDKFLAGLEEQRPSLVHSRVNKRRIEVEKTKEDHRKRQREQASMSKNLNNERLQEDLSRPISEDNKGFQLLAKMGYKAGSSLGKQEKNGRIEPIGISIKNDRAGLGREKAIADLAAKRLELRQAHLLEKAGIQSGEEITTEAYRRRATQKAEERKLIFDVKRCQQTCESLDLEAGIQQPDLPCFWPPKPQEEKESDEEEVETEDTDEESYSPMEQLDMLTSYLRTSYNFCYWCGTHYESSDDLVRNCPGTTKDDH